MGMMISPAPMSLFSGGGRAVGSFKSSGSSSSGEDTPYIRDKKRELKCLDLDSYPINLPSKHGSSITEIGDIATIYMDYNSSLDGDNDTLPSYYNPDGLGITIRFEIKPTWDTKIRLSKYPQGRSLNLTAFDICVKLKNIIVEKYTLNLNYVYVVVKGEYTYFEAPRKKHYHKPTQYVEPFEWLPFTSKYDCDLNDPIFRFNIVLHEKKPGLPIIKSGLPLIKSFWMPILYRIIGALAVLWVLYTIW